MNPALDPNRGPTIGVVVVSYNSAEWLRRCLSSVPAASRRHDSKVIVFDNASDDGSADLVASEFPGVHLVRSQDNVGFARAVNQTAGSLDTDYLLLLNPDGYLEENAVDELVEFAEANPSYTICGGRTLTPAGGLDPRSCWAAPSLWSVAANAVMLSAVFKRSRVFSPEAMVGFQRDHIRQVDIVTGCLLLIRTSDWVELGGFDERYFVYGEDADLCLRARERGLRCAITPDAVMVHAGGESAESTPRHHELVFAGRITLLLAHWSPVKARVGQALIVASVLLRVWLGYLTGRGDRVLWFEVWRRRRQWWGGYRPPASREIGGIDMTPLVHQPGDGGGRFGVVSRGRRLANALRSVLDPRSWLHALRLLHYYHYTHVSEVPKLRSGLGVRLAPNVSLTNATLISLGDGTNIGARCHLWAGETVGSIAIGRNVRLAPNCFLIASNYGVEPGVPFLQQSKEEKEIVIGDNVWLGAGVIVLPGVSIGDDAVIAAGAVVTADIPAGVIAGGVPARVLRHR